MNESVCEQLKQLLAQYGPDLCTDRQRLEGLLRDFCGQHRREINVLVAAVREGVPGELLKVSHTQVDAWQFQRLVQRLHEDAGIAEQFARWAVESWAVALGKELPGELKKTSSPQEPAAGELQDAEAWNDKGCSPVKLGRHEEVIRHYDRALERDPQDAFAWGQKGFSLAELGRYEEAIRCYDRALEIDPQDAFAWRMKGASLAKLGRHEEAIRCYDRALEIDPQAAFTWCRKGVSLAELGRHDEAIRCYDRALEIEPQSDLALSMKGVSLAELGRYVEAILCWKR